MKECKNPLCRIIFESNSYQQELCGDCYLIKRRADLCRARKKYKDTHPKEQIGNPKDDAKILRFLREKREKEDRRHMASNRRKRC
ncbi:MAG: hypothetical protein EHM34_00355 [Nitrosopumilales archaeon]|nr:MAG: hypothetical protein EHM34_00355 [Nitrosopumilales archaeon]